MSTFTVVVSESISKSSSRNQRPVKDMKKHRIQPMGLFWGRPARIERSSGILCVALTALLVGNAVAGPQDEQLPRGEETDMDLPASFHRYYGQRVNQWRDSERYIAKLDIDGDMNYDGTIDNSDPADNGAFEATPPGLVVGEGELTKILIRFSPYRINFKGEVVLGLEVAGVNRAIQSGQFDSFEEEISSTGRIRVWADPQRTQLLLDSADPEKRYYEWVVDDQAYPANLPGVYPRLVYVEGVSVAGAIGPNGKSVIVSEKGGMPPLGYAGDLRLLMTVSHREAGGSRENYGEYRKKALKAFRTSFDHILFTVRKQPQPKGFINNNAEGVWLNVPGGAEK